MKKTIVTILIILTNVIFTFGTPQRGDRIHWNGNVYRLWPFPLELWKGYELTYERLFGVKEIGYATDCYRGYQAEWKVIDNDLYLTAIYSCSYFFSGEYGDSLKADLSLLFPDRLKNGLVVADWVSGDFWISKGEIIYSGHGGIAIYENDIRLTFNKGALTEIKEFNNLERSIKSAFTETPEILHEFLYSNINWEILPELNDSNVRVFVSFVIREPGKLQDVRIVRGAGGQFDNQAKRVIALIPEWTIYFTLGEYYPESWTLPIIFNEENRKKYAR